MKEPLQSIRKVEEVLDVMESLGINKEEPNIPEGFVDIESLIGKEATDSHLVYFLPEIDEYAISRAKRKRVVDLVIQPLTEREEKVLRMRFGVGDEATEHTIDDVGSEFSVTPERIRQIESKALRKKRHPRVSKTLKVFLG